MGIINRIFKRNKNKVDKEKKEGNENRNNNSKSNSKNVKQRKKNAKNKLNKSRRRSNKVKILRRKKSKKTLQTSNNSQSDDNKTPVSLSSLSSNEIHMSKKNNHKRNKKQGNKQKYGRMNSSRKKKKKKNLVIDAPVNLDTLLSDLTDKHQESHEYDEEDGEYYSGDYSDEDDSFYSYYSSMESDSRSSRSSAESSSSGSGSDTGSSCEDDDREGEKLNDGAKGERKCKKRDSVSVTSQGSSASSTFKDIYQYCQQPLTTFAMIDDTSTIDSLTDTEEPKRASKQHGREGHCSTNETDDGCHAGEIVSKLPTKAIESKYRECCMRSETTYSVAATALTSKITESNNCVSPINSDSKEKQHQNKDQEDHHIVYSLLDRLCLTGNVTTTAADVASANKKLVTN